MNKLRLAWRVWRIYREVRSMKALSNSIQWANIAGMVAQVAGLFPSNKYALLVQGIIAAVLPSLHGVGHAVVFGTKQK